MTTGRRGSCKRNEWSSHPRFHWFIRSPDSFDCTPRSDFKHPKKRSEQPTRLSRDIMTEGGGAVTFVLPVLCDSIHKS